MEKTAENDEILKALKQVVYLKYEFCDANIQLYVKFHVIELCDILHKLKINPNDILKMKEEEEEIKY